MPGVRCEVMCKAWTSVPDVLCEVRSSVCVFCLGYVVLCEVWGSVRGVRFCVRCYARGMEFCHMFCARYMVLCQISFARYVVMC